MVISGPDDWSQSRFHFNLGPGTGPCLVPSLMAWLSYYKSFSRPGHGPRPGPGPSPGTGLKLVLVPSYFWSQPWSRSR